MCKNYFHSYMKERMSRSNNSMTIEDYREKVKRFVKYDLFFVVAM